VSAATAAETENAGQVGELMVGKQKGRPKPPFP
jgi:hypothetical protein